MPSSVKYGSLPFKKQIEFFQKKLAMPTKTWTDIYAGEHDHAFMVAGAAKMAIVEDFQRTIGDMIENGKTIADFRKEFDAIVERHGWAYKGGRNWRTRVIYETNLRQSYHAGREAQMADPELRKARPYGLYRHGGSEDPRPEHLELDGTVLPLDDEFWDTWSPQNGWGCTCKKYMVSDQDLARLKLKVSERPPVVETETKTIGIRGPNPRTVTVPKGIDPGFEHRPGANRLRGVTPTQLDEPIRSEPGRTFPPRLAGDALPSARELPSKLLPEGLEDEAYLKAFLKEFGADIGKPVVFKDAVGERISISEALFLNNKGELKVTKRERASYLPLLAATVLSPDEIWVAAEWHRSIGRAVLRRRYIARYTVEGSATPGIAVFEWGRGGWAGVTTFNSSDEYVERFRQGVRLYRREE